MKKTISTYMGRDSWMKTCQEDRIEFKWKKTCEIILKHYIYNIACMYEISKQLKKEIKILFLWIFHNFIYICYIFHHYVSLAFLVSPPQLPIIFTPHFHFMLLINNSLCCSQKLRFVAIHVGGVRKLPVVIYTKKSVPPSFSSH